jgi:hypothetical protein
MWQLRSLRETMGVTCLRQGLTGQSPMPASRKRAILPSLQPGGLQIVSGASIIPIFAKVFLSSGGRVGTKKRSLSDALKQALSGV